MVGKLLTLRIVVTQIFLLLLLIGILLPASTAFLAPSSSFKKTERHFYHHDSFPLTRIMSSLQEIEVITDPTQEFLDKKGVFGWGTWGCGVSKFPWTYSEAESCYLLRGKVMVTPKNASGGDGQPVLIQAGNFVTFPAGMSCTWDVQEAVEKHFMFY